MSESGPSASDSFRGRRSERPDREAFCDLASVDLGSAAARPPDATVWGLAVAWGLEAADAFWEAGDLPVPVGAPLPWPFGEFAAVGFEGFSDFEVWALGFSALEDADGLCGGVGVDGLSAFLVPPWAPRAGGEESRRAPPAPFGEPLWEVVAEALGVSFPDLAGAGAAFFEGALAAGFF